MKDDAFDPVERLRSLGISLPASGTVAGSYVPAVRTGRLLYVSGQIPRSADGSPVRGRVGVDVSAEEAAAHARLACIELLAVVAEALGGLEHVRRVVKVNGYVNADPAFTAQPAVIDGCSNLLVEVFGERGRHARAAIGVASLPGGASVEVEAILETDASSGNPGAT